MDAWNVSNSPPSSATGAWNRPSVDIRKTVWGVQKPCNYVTVDGTIDLDTRFFIAPNGYMHDYSITVALTCPQFINQPLDWNTEGPSPRNPSSFIHLEGGRITIDEELACVSFSIRLPTHTKWFPCPGDARAFGVRVKAFAVDDPSGSFVTATNEAPFVVVNHIASTGNGERRKSVRR